MVEFEADDALASGAVAAARDMRVERVIICTPDKDLAQCVRGERIVQLNRRTRITWDEQAVVKKFGVSPQSIPDYLAGRNRIIGLQIESAIRSLPSLI
jgi:5'-3' exonuclease